MTQAAEVLAAFRARGWHLATAESCTGGLIAAALTEVAGSSAVFDWGVVSYSNAAKIDLLGVSPETLERHGAVSEEVALEMALGARTRAGAPHQSTEVIALSVTGIAGPGGSEHKPEGRVCFGLATPSDVTAETVEFGPLGRAAVRQASVAHALQTLLRVAAHKL